MRKKAFQVGGVGLVLGTGLCLALGVYGQPPATVSAALEGTAPAAEAPPVPKGVEVMTRGPIHEAFATPTTPPEPTQPIPKRPPAPITELPPDEKPEGNVLWIGGYWAWDEDRNDFLWVSGIWRAVPPGRQWVAGYWREQGDNWQWAPGC